MTDKAQVLVFGEVLFDCFPGGEQVLGGAPFNVAWHLQALGEQPHFISRVGDDELGGKILSAMNDWGMDASTVQLDPVHSTGRVEIEVIEDEPHYTIIPDCAYDFIDAEGVAGLPSNGILYHGTLGLRNPVSRAAFQRLAKQPELSIFLDVNLRSPWWSKDEVYRCLERAQWVKLNEDELQQLGFCSADIREEMSKMQSQFQLQQLIVTRGGEGALVLSEGGGFDSVKPKSVKHIVDTVGAGDAFTAIYIHGLMSDWSVADSLTMAQQFASEVIGLRGAITTDPDFYRHFID
ncbi:carbohydrate kinase [Methylomarinum sp. Ch1-1]|uniref:Carbohydrate kinase n=1 Tax=Methylomarinum roseum TaxID=3067653 RepID=A0AAU7NYH8_9GAMM|nr:carbohydrate kinase [Methylomarinum sp. Ch1-1]MDP4521809.1 carbohydrate kinase [Methylomarinum sp. Ch1-1]